MTRRAWLLGQPAWLRAVPIGIVLALCFAGYAHAQFGFRGFGRAVRMAPVVWPDRNFAVCRIMYQSVRNARAADAGWSTDYPRGETNLSIRFSELTLTH